MNYNSISLLITNISILILAIWNYQLEKKCKMLLKLMEMQNSVNKANLETLKDVHYCLSCLIPEIENDREN